MALAHVYLRVSTDKQDVRAQVDACHDWLARNPYEAAGPYEEDAGLSGATPFDRCPALSLALGAMRRGDVLLCQKRDRVARDRLKILMLEAFLKKRGVRVVSAAGEGTGGDDYDDPTNVLLRGVTDLFAEYERLTVGWRTRAKLATKKKAGERTGGVPYGKELYDDGRRSRVSTRTLPDGSVVEAGGLPIALRDHPAEKRVLGWMVNRHRDGWSAGRILDRLDALGVPYRGGRPWQRSTVIHLLKSHRHEDFPDEPTPHPDPPAAPEDGR